MRPQLCLALLASACAEPPLTLEAGRTSLAREAMAEVDGERVFALVAELVEVHKADTALDCAQLAGASEVVCHTTHVGARAWLTTQLAALGYEVSQQTSQDGALEVVNVVAELSGSSRELVLVGAHYDAAFAAANDDSSGVAVMLELARVLRGRALGRTVRFVGFDLEELGAVGSASYARALPVGEPLAAVITLDGVGISAERQPVLPGLALPSTGDFLAVVANGRSAELGATIRALSQALALRRTEVVVAAGDGSAPLLGLYSIGSGDRTPFWVRGDPAIVFSDTQPVRTTRYHNAQDDLAGLDPLFLSDSARIAAASVAYLAGAAP